MRQQWWPLSPLFRRDSSGGGRLRLPRHGVDRPDPDTLKGIVSTLPRERSLVRAEQLAEALEVKAAHLGQPRVLPARPDHLCDSDGILFLTEVSGGGS